MACFGKQWNICHNHILYTWGKCNYLHYVEGYYPRYCVLSLLYTPDKCYVILIILKYVVSYLDSNRCLNYALIQYWINLELMITLVLNFTSSCHGMIREMVIQSASFEENWIVILCVKLYRSVLISCSKFSFSSFSPQGAAQCDVNLTQSMQRLPRYAG